MPVRELVDHFASVFESTWTELDVAPSRFVRTTDPVARAQRDGDPAAAFTTPAGSRSASTRAATASAASASSPSAISSTGSAATTSASPSCAGRANYFFLMSRAFGWLREHYERNPGFLRPERYRNEALAMLRDESGLGDLSISRPEDAPRMGHRAALRPRPRLLRLVRRADQLPDRRRLSRRSRLRRALGERRTPDRQGHPEAPRDLLADHAEGDRPRAARDRSRCTATGTSTTARSRRVSAT